MLHLRCAKETGHILEDSNVHQHPLELSPLESYSHCNHQVSYGVLCYNCYQRDLSPLTTCKTCDEGLCRGILCYRCYQCDVVIHEECAEFFPEATHTFHPQHPLKPLKLAAAPDCADDKCLLCGIEFYKTSYGKFHHCDVCNFSICNRCMKQPPPARVESPTTHEHELHLFPRRIYFTCNACGTLGDRSPYFCLQCNFMIHRECIDLPRVININRHDHPVSYTRRLGHGEEWKCKVCREEVDGFYGGYTCVKYCPSFAVHSICATRKDVWDMVELEGMPEEEEEEIDAPFEVIDANTIKHCSHDHKLLRINKDGHDGMQPESIVCEACRLHILSEPFYSCEQCCFILHEKCANHPRKRRHVSSNQPLTLITDSPHKVDTCGICEREFSGFRYKGISSTIDVRCAATPDTLVHESHPHPLYFNSFNPFAVEHCSNCRGNICVLSCDECDYKLDFRCADRPKKVMNIRYDDHPLVLAFFHTDVDGEYWCEACEERVHPKKWFYTCDDCGTILHLSCAVGDLFFIKPGSQLSDDEQVVCNTSSCRSFCSCCNSRCNQRSVIKISSAEGDQYFCGSFCLFRYKNNMARLR